MFKSNENKDFEYLETEEGFTSATPEEFEYQALKDEFFRRAERMKREFSALNERMEKVRNRWKVKAICPDLSDDEADEIGWLL